MFCTQGLQEPHHPRHRRKAYGIGQVKLSGKGKAFWSARKDSSSLSAPPPPKSSTVAEANHKAQPDHSVVPSGKKDNAPNKIWMLTQVENNRKQGLKGLGVSWPTACLYKCDTESQT